MDPIELPALEASFNNPDDPYEITLLADVASVGKTRPIKSTGRSIDWTAEMLDKRAGTLKGMPINLSFKDDGRIDNHSRVVVGNVKEAFFDKARNKMVATGTLWKHYFPKTMEDLLDMHASGEAQTSIEFMPTKMERPDDETDRPIDGRFTGLGIVDDGADTGNFIQLLASAKKESDDMIREKAKPFVSLIPGSYEWIGEQFIGFLTASAKVDDFKDVNVVATYADRVVYQTDSKFYETPYSLEGNTIKFNDTIEVEAAFKPLELSVSGTSTPTPIESTQKEPVKPMAEIDEKELQELRASASDKDKLAADLKELQASKDELETKLADSEKKVADAEAEREERKLEQLAASRMEEVEKIKKYEDAELKKGDLEVFKTLDEKAFELVKRNMLAAAAAPGGVENGGEAPLSREDEDGAARTLMASAEYKDLLARVSRKEDK